MIVNIPNYLRGEFIKWVREQGYSLRHRWDDKSLDKVTADLKKAQGNQEVVKFCRRKKQYKGGLPRC